MWIPELIDQRISKSNHFSHVLGNMTHHKSSPDIGIPPGGNGGVENRYPLPCKSSILFVERNPGTGRKSETRFILIFHCHDIYRGKKPSDRIYIRVCKDGSLINCHLDSLLLSLMRRRIHGSLQPRIPARESFEPSLFLECLVSIKPTRWRRNAVNFYFCSHNVMKTNEIRLGPWEIIIVNHNNILATPLICDKGSYLFS